LDTVLGTLAELRYDAIWTTIRASDVGAPHKRERLFVVAYPNSLWKLQSKGSVERIRGRIGDRSAEDVADAESERCAEVPPRGWALVLQAGCHRRQTEPGVGGMFDGFPARLDQWPAGIGEDQHAWEPPRSIKNLEARAHRLKALGNSVVPQCAEIVGRIVLGLGQYAPNVYEFEVRNADLSQSVP